MNNEFQFAPKSHPTGCQAHSAEFAPSDAEKYRWIRANRGNFGISEALTNSDRDLDFDTRIELEMKILAAGRDSYCSGGRL